MMPLELELQVFKYLKLKVWAIFAVMAGIIGTYLLGKRDAAKNIEIKSMKNNIKQTKKVNEIARDVRRESKTKTDDDVISDLESKWMRNSKDN